MLAMPVSTSDLLIEIDYGEWEGMVGSEIEAKYPNRYQNGQLSIDPPGGQSRSISITESSLAMSFIFSQ